MSEKICIFFLVFIPLISSEFTYTSYDDASWAIVSKRVSDMLGSGRDLVYQQFMETCKSLAPTCEATEESRLRMNQYQPPSMYNFTEMGFKKVRAPAAVMGLINDFWEANKGNLIRERDAIDPFHNLWEAPTSMASVHNKTLTGAGEALASAIADATRELMEEWTGMRQMSTAVYGVRAYHHGSTLSPHVDRMPLVSSCIINVAQDVDEDWVLEVYGHDGKAHNVTMQPGDLVLYESHSVIHGRPFPLKGRFYANIFVHFEPLGPLNATEMLDPNYPPYLIPGSTWDMEWRRSNPKGWSVFRDINKLVVGNEMVALQYVAQLNASRLGESDVVGWAPVHEAARQGNVEIMKFLYEHGVDMNTITTVMNGATPLDVAEKLKGRDHAVSTYLRSIDARTMADLVFVDDGESQGFGIVVDDEL